MASFETAPRHTYVTVEQERPQLYVVKAAFASTEDAFYALWDDKHRLRQPLYDMRTNKPIKGKVATGWHFDDEQTFRLVVMRPDNTVKKALPSATQPYIAPTRKASSPVIIDFDPTLPGPVVVQTEKPAPKPALTLEEGVKRIMRGQALPRAVKKAATPAPNLRRYQSGQWG